MDHFVAYSGLHLVTVCVCLALIGGLVAAGFGLRLHEAGLRRALGAFGLLYWVSYNVWWNWHGIDPASGLPLQVCDVNGVIAPLALMTLRRPLRATLYFWSFALTSQAFIQPALQNGPTHLLFWWFWARHTIILGYAAFDVAVLGFRPDRRDLAWAYGAGALYLAVVVPIDLWLGADYGYLGNLPLDQIPPFVAALGPWPLRAVVLVALAAIGFVIVALPWQFARKAQARGTKLVANAPALASDPDAAGLPGEPAGARLI